MNNRKLAFTSGVLLVNCAAMAVEESPQIAQQADIPKIMEVVEVTARKRVEKIQDVPMSVSAVTPGRIKDLGINDIQDLSIYVPGLEQPKLPIQSRLSIRGVSSGDNNAFEQAVGTYVDGLYHGRMHLQRSGFFDMERIEVLKGPQVALYGNSSIGGAISMFTTRPEFELGGFISGRYEFEYQQKQITGAINLPVTDTFAMRLSGKWLEQDEGLSVNAFDGKESGKPDDSAYRLSALWRPTSDLEVFMRYEQGSYEFDGHNLDPFKHVSDGAGTPWQPAIFTGINDGELNVGNEAPFLHNRTYWETDVDEGMIQVTYQLDDYVLTSLSGWSSYDFEQSMDVDITPQTLINVLQFEDYQQFSQEFRLEGELSGRSNFLVGVYYQQSEANNDYFADFNVPALLAGAFGAPSALFEPLLGSFSRDIILRQDTDQWAIFGHLNYELSEKWTASLGYRLTKMEKDANQIVQLANLQHQIGNGDLVDARWLLPDFASQNLLANPDYLADPTGYVITLADGTQVDPILVPEYLLGFNVVSTGKGVVHNFDNLNRKETHPMYQTSLKYQWDDSTMTYVSYANGAKAGGFDFLYEGGVRDEVEYQDESVDVFEIGLKKDWSKVRLNLAAFYGKYDDLQVSVFDGGIGFTVGNAASSVSQGIDGELTYVITDDFTLFANFEYLDFTYDEFKDANCSFSEKQQNPGVVLCDWSDRQAPFIPRIKTVLAAEYFHTVGPHQLRQLLSISYKSGHTTASDNEVLTRQGGFSLVDYRAELIAPAANWSVGLTVKNLFDKDYNNLTSVIPLAPGGAFAHGLTKGREVAVELNYFF